MDAKNLLSLNSKRLKKYFQPINPVFGDPDDPLRFLFNVNGIPKAYLPAVLKKQPLIINLMKARSVSSFLRSSFFKSNFRSVADMFISLKNIRAKYDFLYWLHLNVPEKINYRHNLSLIRFLQHQRWSGQPLRIIVSHDSDCFLALIYAMFFIWFTESAPKALNVMHVANQHNIADLQNAYLEYDPKPSSNPHPLKKTYRSAIYSPQSDSKFWFVSPSTPDKCRGLDFAFLLFYDMGNWPSNRGRTNNPLIGAAFPVVLTEADSAIILDSGPASSNSLFRHEFTCAKNNLTPFSHFIIPWSDNTSRVYKFDYSIEKTSFYERIIKYRDRNTFPHAPFVSGKYLYQLWNNGLPLEVIHWYATEGGYFSSKSQFLKTFPISPP